MLMTGFWIPTLIPSLFRQGIQDRKGRFFCMKNQVLAFLAGLRVPVYSRTLKALFPKDLQVEENLPGPRCARYFRGALFRYLIP
jgi:hypothetical protein